MKRALGFGFWVTHTAVGNPWRVYPLVAWLSFFGCFVQLATVSGGYDFISFIVLVILFILFRCRCRGLYFGFSLCKFDILVTPNCCTIILASPRPRPQSATFQPL